MRENHGMHHGKYFCDFAVPVNILTPFVCALFSLATQHTIVCLDKVQKILTYCNFTVFSFHSRKTITTIAITNPMTSKTIMMTRTIFTPDPQLLLPLLLVVPAPAQSVKKKTIHISRHNHGIHSVLCIQLYSQNVIQMVTI